MDRRAKGKHPSPLDANQGPTLFPGLAEREAAEPTVRQLQYPIWTENKAKLIERYLFYFVQITKHGTYIDGFAGPQNPDKPETWAAKLVLESEPKWLRHFYLFEKNRSKARMLEELKRSQPEPGSQREIQIYHGDFNVLVEKVLRPDKIGPREATFCLLDQQTFECHWRTVRKLAECKREGTKIELFYFLAARWLGRAIAGIVNVKLLRDWWGRDDWSGLENIGMQGIQQEILQRFKTELGYRSVKPWPIYDRQGGETIMYYMIHATDYPGAPELMSRAYELAVHPKESPEQLKLGLGLTSP